MSGAGDVRIKHGICYVHRTRIISRTASRPEKGDCDTVTVSKDAARLLSRYPLSHSLYSRPQTEDHTGEDVLDAGTIRLVSMQLWKFGGHISYSISLGTVISTGEE